MLAAQHLLVGALFGHDVGLAAGFAQQAQGQGQAVVQGNEGRQPGLQVGAARGFRLVLPGVVRRHVDLGGAARHRQAAPQAGEPFVLAQRLAGLAGRRQGRHHFLEFAQHAFERVLRHPGMIAQPHQRHALAFEILQHRAFHVGAFAHVEQIEQRTDRDLVLP